MLIKNKQKKITTSFSSGFTLTSGIFWALAVLTVSVTAVYLSQQPNPNNLNTNLSINQIPRTNPPQPSLAPREGAEDSSLASEGTEDSSNTQGVDENSSLVSEEENDFSDTSSDEEENSSNNNNTNTTTTTNLAGIQTESDPIFLSWNKQDDIKIKESQIKDLQDYLTDLSSFTTNHLTEGTTNQYFTKNRAISALTGQNLSLFTNDTNYLTEETDPIFSSWNKSTGITITESQITNLQSYLTSISGLNISLLTNNSNYITASTSDTLTNKVGNISMWTNDSNYITDGNTNWNNEYSFITNLSSFTTDNLTQGTTNKYTQWTTNGTTISYLNNIGIGTTTPHALLHLSSTSGGEGILFTDTSASAGNKQMRIQFHPLPGGTSPAGIIFQKVNDDNSWGADLLTIRNNGYLGVGTNTPSYKLDVNGTGRFSDTLSITSGGLILTTGNLGIGTTNPQNKLHLFTGDGTSGLRTSLICSNSTSSKLLTDASGNLICGVDQTGSGTGNLIDTLADTLAAGNDANNLGIINLGNIGIGTTTPTTALQIGTSLNITSLGAISGASGNISMWTNDSGYLTSYTETDPVFSAWDKSTGISITESQISNLQSYLTSYTETDPIFLASQSNNITASHLIILGNTSNTNTGDETQSSIQTKLGTATTTTSGYLTSTDWNIFNNKQPAGSYLTGTKVDSFNTRTGAVTLSSSDVTTALTFTPYNATNPAGYISSYTETDPVFSAWDKSTGISITESQISDLQTYLTNLSSLTTDNLTQGTTNLYSQWATSGSNISFVGGNVGIGTTSPGAKLEVVGSINVSSNVILNTNGSSNYFGITGASGGWARGYRFIGSSGTLQGGLWANGNDDVVNYYTIGSAYNAGLTVLQSSGNVGIGTTAPGHKLTAQAATSLTGTVAAQLSLEDSSAIAADIGSAILFRAKYTGTTLTELAAIQGGKETATDGQYGGNLRFFARLDGGGAVGSYERMRITSTGNVGIGTTSPGAKLEIGMPAAGVSPFLVKGEDGNYKLQMNTNNFVVSPGSSSGAFYINNYNNLASLVTVLNSGNVGIGTTTPGAKLQVNGDVTNTGYNSGQIYIQGASNPNQRLNLGYDTTNNYVYLQGALIGSNYVNTVFNAFGGNVGIGFTNPSSKLTVGIPIPTSVSVANSSIYMRGTDNGYGLAMGNLAGGHAWIQSMLNDAAGIDLSLNPIAGNVGIGTTGPVTKLHVYGANPVLRMEDSGTAQTHVGFKSNSVDKAYVGTESSTGTGIIGTGNAYSLVVGTASTNPLQLFTNNAVAMTILNGGNVGIGTASPVQKLDVVGGNIKLTTGMTKLIFDNELRYIQGYRSGADYLTIAEHSYAAGIQLGFANAADPGSGNPFFPTMTITAASGGTGNVGIGTTGPDYALRVQSGAVAGNGAYVNLASHSSKKENFESVSVLGIISQLNIQEWQYKPEYALGDNTRHLYPFADDFFNKFGLGKDEWRITAEDMAGVALKGIQELDLKTSNQIAGLTDNQNQITAQITGQLANQTLSIEDKINLIGDNLEALNQEQYDKQIKKIKEQLEENTLQLGILDTVLGIEENNLNILGNITALEGNLDELTVGALVIKSSSNLPKTIGEILLCPSGKAGVECDQEAVSDGESIFVETSAVSETAKIFITAENKIGGEAWIEKETDYSGFKIKINPETPIAQPIKFNWWIVEEK